MGLSLPPSVGLCFVSGSALVLDTRADRYWMLPSDSGRALQAATAGHAIDSASRAAVERLITSGLIERNDGDIPLVLPTIPTATRSALAEALAVRALPIAAAWMRVAQVERVLVRRGLAYALSRIDRTRRSRRTVSAESLKDVVAGFSGLRLLRRSQGRCLPLSLALATRCADPEIQLILGVKLGPFAAHAWVQSGKTVLNDDVETIAPFTPIYVR